MSTHGRIQFAKVSPNARPAVCDLKERVDCGLIANVRKRTAQLSARGECTVGKIVAGWRILFANGNLNEVDCQRHILEPPEQGNRN